MNRGLVLEWLMFYFMRVKQVSAQHPFGMKHINFIQQNRSLLQ